MAETTDAEAAAARAWALEVDVAVSRAAWSFVPPLLRDHPNATRMHARHCARLHELLREVGEIARRHRAARPPEPPPVAPALES